MARKLKTEAPSPLTWWEEMLRGQRNGLLADSLRRAARLGSWGYRMGVKGREVAYQKGLLRVKRLPRTTVCVGNITVGGTGKTPLVMRLVNDLLAAGRRPAVLLRGYKRETRTIRPVLVRGPEKVYATVQESGDEAMELALRLPGSCVGVGADRHAVGSMILSRFPVDCFVMDDGFQHYQLYRDVNIVTLDVTDPWGGGRLLPAGLLRESPEALRRADLVILTRVGLVSPDRLLVLRAQVADLLPPSAAILESRHEPRCLIRLADSKEFPLSALKGRKILAVSGIANPQSFEATLTSLGADIKAHRRFGDHRGRPEELWEWAARHHRPEQWVLMTEKDAVRWGRPESPSLAGTSSGRPERRGGGEAFALRMELILSSGQSRWQKLIKSLSVHAG